MVHRARSQAAMMIFVRGFCAIAARAADTPHMRDRAGLHVAAVWKCHWGWKEELIEMFGVRRMRPWFHAACRRSLHSYARATHSPWFVHQRPTWTRWMPFCSARRPRRKTG